MNEQSAFIINEESHEKIIKENEWVLHFIIIINAVLILNWKYNTAIKIT